MWHQRGSRIIAGIALCFAATVGLGQTITDFSPTFGQPGSYVTINGSNFVSGVTTVRFNGTPATAHVTTTSQIQATVPTGMTPGAISVKNSGSWVYSKSSFTNIGAGPFITNFSPDHGTSKTAVVITGANFTNVSGVKFAGVAAAFTPPTIYTEIRATAPNGVQTGPITVTTPLGTYTTSNSFYGPPVITAFTPTSGRGGAAVKITGTNFTAASQVSFNGVPAVFTIDSANQITATVPTNATKGPIGITAPAMTTASASSFVMLPDIFSFSPTFGPAGTVVTINGWCLKSGTTIVKFNGTTASPTSVATNKIIVAVPGGATAGPITVSTDDGTDITTNNFYLPPVFSGFSPNQGQPGATVTITGQNLTNASAVYFNQAAATFTAVNNNLITAVVPARATTGPMSLSTPGGSATNSTFYVPPVLGGFAPTHGLASSTVTLTGSFPDGATSVTINGVSAAFTVVSTNTITATVPTNGTTGPIMVTAAGGTSQSSGSFQVDIPFLPPVITGFSPAFGPVGTLVTVTGSNLNVGTVAVKFNGAGALPGTTSATQLTVKVPSGAVSGPLTVTNRDGLATTTNNFLLPPVVASFSPANGAVGTPVTLIGTNFTNATAVSFNGVAGTFKVVNNNQITTAVPALASSGPIRIVTPAGTNATVASFLVPPDITGFTPVSGVPGASVTISGAFPDGVISVLFNGIPATVTQTNATQLIATVPTDATTGPLTVNALGGSDVTTTNFTVVVPVRPPVISSFSPTVGSVGTVVTLVGSNLNVNPVTVKFNSTVASPSVVLSNQITVAVPSGASSGPITVTTKDGAFTTATIFQLPPTITNFQPTNGIPGTSVTISGVEFTNASQVTFNGVAAVFHVVNNNQIVAAVPPTPTTGAIGVTTPAGAFSTRTPFFIPPSITGFSPASNFIGTTVTLTGFFPDGANSVLFNKVSGQYSTAGTTQIVAVVPAGAVSGPIVVNAMGGSSQTLSSFTVNPTKLGISRAANNSTTLTWPGTSGFVLEYLAAVHPVNQWQTDTNTVRSSNGNSVVVEKVSGATRFFRLQTQ